jgi:DNA ligase 1
MSAIRLECTTGGHNKFYEFHGIQNNGRFTVKGLYGAIGQAPKVLIIYHGDNKVEANEEFQKKLNEKKKKGYVVVMQNGQSVPAPAEKKNGGLPIIWPMNAQGIKNKDHLEQLLLDKNYVAQEKLDGMRAIIHITKSGLRIFSRSAGVDDPTRPLEKTSALPHLAELRFPEMAGTVLDGELLIAGKDSAALTGTVNSKEPNRDNTKVTLYVFDCLQFCGKDLRDKRLWDRLIVLFSHAHKLFSTHIIVLPYFNTAATKRNLYTNVFGGNGEGIMLKNLNASYTEGGRPSNNWYKVKKSATFDCVVMGFTKGKGKFNNRIGALIFGQYVNGKLTELGQASGMTESERNDMSLHPDKYIGKVVTIKGMERLKSGAIRHPQYGGMRTDKDRFECRWYSNEQ